MNILTQSINQSPQPELRAGDTSHKPAVQAQVQKVQQAQQKSEPSPLQLQQAVQSINRKLANSTALEFTVDQNSGRTVVKVMDKDSGELIRQIPSEAALAIAESIGEFQKGLLLKQEV